MHTGQLHYYPKCKIRNVAYADKMEYLSFDVESESGAHLNTISVCNRTVKDDIRKLLSHPTIRLFWAYGITEVSLSVVPIRGRDVDFPFAEGFALSAR